MQSSKQGWLIEYDVDSPTETEQKHYYKKKASSETELAFLRFEHDLQDTNLSSRYNS